MSTANIDNAVTDFNTEAPSVIIGDQEYCLNSDGTVQHRQTGNITWLSCRRPIRPTPAEKLALQKLLIVEAAK